MKHNQYNIDFSFVREPIRFDKYSEKEFLAYCLGATLYMPATRDFDEIIINRKYPGLASMVFCFEDAIDEKDVPEAEAHALKCLDNIAEAIESGRMDKEKLPLLFARVRTPEQFEGLAKRFEKKHLQLMTGFVFPKFTEANGEGFYRCLTELSKKHDEILYGMPVLESPELAFKEIRFNGLMAIRKIIDKYSDVTLNIRVGATDFSSVFAVRRGIDYSIYDILPVQDCLLDILNVFARNNDYIVSGPVWEFFLVSKGNKFDENVNFSLQSSILKRKKLVNEAIDGLLREVIIDKANGFVGKTVIHPTHIKYVNAMQAVTEEEYNDAMQILEASGGVMKSLSANKMNEVNPHRNWAKKLYNRALAYGVIKDETEYLKLVSSEDFK